MDLKSKKTAKEKGQRQLSNLLGLDFASSGIKAVRLKKVKEQITLTAADILPAIGFNASERPEIPKSLSAYYAALCATTDDATLRVFSHVLQDEENLQEVVRSNLSLPEESRVGGMILSRGKGKRESSILGVAVPEKTVQYFLSLFASGAPAPHSLELSGLAAFSAFFYNFGEQTAGKTICLIETGARFTYAAFFYQNQLQIINRFDVGGAGLQKQIQKSLGVDAEMASTILAGGSVDVAAPVRQALAPLIKQLAVYREFVERQNKSVLDGVYLSGGEAASPYWQSAIEGVLGLAPVVWNPFEKLDIAPDAFPEKFIGQESRFAAAVGTALAGMETI